MGYSKYNNLVKGSNTKSSVRQKLNNHSGFTLTELLSTILIMSLVGIMITTGIVTAIRVYRQVTEYSEAQMLLTNTLTLLEDELIYAKPDSISTGSDSVTYSHIKNGDTKLYEVTQGDTKKGICISYHYKPEDSEEYVWTTPEPLVSYEKYENLYTDWEIKSTASQSDKTKIITLDLFIKSGTETIISIKDYKIQTLNKIHS